MSSFQIIRKVGARILEEKERKKAEGVQLETLLREGHAVKEIIRARRGGRFDLAVIGARVLSRIKEIVLGSASDDVTRHAYCPVLVVK
ncbi:MAG: universal stress protein [Candidatus Jordarchaeales archaeon]